MRIKSLLIAVVLGISLMPVVALADSTVPEQFVDITPPNSRSLVGVWFNDDIDLTRIPTSLFSIDQQTGKALSFCKSLTDPACASASTFSYNALLPPCASTQDVDCIEDLYAINPATGQKILAVAGKMMPAQVVQPYQGHLTAGLPQGSNSNIWTIPGVNNGAGTDQYALVVTRQGTLDKNGSGSFSSSPGSFRAGLFPITDSINAAYHPNVPIIGPQQYYGVSHPSTTDFRSCAIVGEGECALRQSFPLNTQFGIDVRLSGKLTGWLHGRIDQPNFSYQQTDYGTHLEVQGFPTVVPSLSGWIDPKSFTDAQKAEFAQYGLPPNSGQESDPLPSGMDSIRSLNMWLDLLGNKATAMPGEWVFHSLDNGELNSASPCITRSNSLAGFVTTNATTYSAGAPTFNKNDASLDYQVAAPHFGVDGQVFLGSYDLFLSSTVARCIYGFSEAPLKGSISIVDSSGANEVATTTLSESNGWLHLAAKGFTFSTPTLKVTLSQDAATPSPSPTPTTTPAASVNPAPVTTASNPIPSPHSSPSKNKSNQPTSQIKRSLKCTKGKVTIVVSSVICPSGFKASRV